MKATTRHPSTGSRARHCPPFHSVLPALVPARLRVAAAALGALLALPALAQVAVPDVINYQGTLTNEYGTSVTNGPYTLTFRVWDSASGGAAPVWGPQVMPNVQVSGGQFNVILGPKDISDRDLATSFTSGATRYLEITVGGQTATPPISPRQRILSVPFAVQAETASDAARVGGRTAAELMTKATYDADGNGKADDADRLGGELAAAVRDALGPIGTIQAWHKNAVSPALALPGGWAECNGQEVVVPTSGPLDPDGNGKYTMPNLNGSGSGTDSRFLRGGTTSGALQNATRVISIAEIGYGSEAYIGLSDGANLWPEEVDEWEYIGGVGRYRLAGTAMPGVEQERADAIRVRPRNMSVVWIMRIK